MYFLALATDYDGTVATDGRIAADTVASLKQLKGTGRRLILVTGRELPQLKEVCPEIDLFDRVVAENGGLLYDPATGEERALASPPPNRLVKRLKRLGVRPLSVGRSIIATWEPHSATVLDSIRLLGLELQIVFNKGAVMVLPPGVNKASGLLAALRELDLSPHNVVAVGDAENDHALIDCCGCGAAVADAVASLRAHAAIRLRGAAGAGVSELCEAMLNDEQSLTHRTRAGIRVGGDEAGRDVFVRPSGGTTLVTGPPESGKSTLITALSERMAGAGYEFFIFDPEGDYFGLRDAVTLGGPLEAPDRAHAMKLLREVGVNLVVNTQALGLDERRSLFRALLTDMAELRHRTGRPHWMVVDEAHQVFGSYPGYGGASADAELSAALLVTAYPDALPKPLLDAVECVIAFGWESSQIARMLGRDLDGGVAALRPGPGKAFWWNIASGAPPCIVRLDPPDQVHRRHKGKYAAGDVGRERSFYFGCASGARARNLFEFMDLSDQVDDRCWRSHLRARDYSAWFRHVIKDPELAALTARIEEANGLSPRESRARIKQAILSLYAAPHPVPRHS